MNWHVPAGDTYFGPILEKDPRGFQIDHLEAALRHCKQFRTAVDGGAHIGTWSKAMAKCFARVLAFEPARDTFECLCQNVPEPNVSKFYAALGAARGTTDVVDDPLRRGNTGARYLGSLGKGKVPVVPLDDHKIEDLDFLKLDLEGYEYHAIIGASDTLWRCKPVVLIEVKDFRSPRFGCDFEAAADLLVDSGYREVERVKNDRIYVSQ